MVCTLFPLESISMYFISCAQKTRGEDKEVTQEPKHVVDSFPLKVTHQYLVEKRNWPWHAPVSGQIHKRLLLCEAARASARILHAGPDAADSRMTPASGSGQPVQVWA